MKMLCLCNLISGFCTLLLLVLLTGCSVKSSPVAYYRLAPLEMIDPEAKAEARLDVALGIGPVTVPEYLKKSQIATRHGDTRYQFAESQRWAGMIEKDIASVIGNNLGLLLGTDQVMFFPWLHHFRPDYRVVVEVVQFDGDLQGDALLIARWAISDSSGARLLASGKSTYRQTLANASYEALVDAEGLLLAEFSRALAVELQALFPLHERRPVLQ